MAFRFFSIPIQGCPVTERELNAFLRTHQVLSIDRQFVDQGTSSVWSFCVDYLDSDAAAPVSVRPAGIRTKVDYREILSPEDFAVFSRLRDARKLFAQTEAVPVYTVFTNDQLAKMVETKAASKSDLEQIVGVGDARVQKYGDRILEVLVKEWSDRRAPDGKSV